MKLIFKDLYIFSPQDKTAKHIPFQEGINIITSNQEDGTDRGKSVIMRSLYYTLGAESHFEAKWDTKNKIYILKFAIDNQEYYLYRASNLYKMFDENKTLECVFFSPFQSWNIRVYLSNLFKNNLLDGNYMKELCKLYGLTFSINFEVEGDYPAVYFFKELNNDKKIKKVK